MQIFVDILERIQERFRNSILSSFFISWSIINYKVFVVILSSDSYESKFDYISTHLFPNGYWVSFCVPAIIALLYVTVFPLFTAASLYVDGKYEIFFLWIKAKLAGRRILTVKSRDAFKLEIDKEHVILQTKINELEGFKYGYIDRVTTNLADFLDVIQTEGLKFLLVKPIQSNEPFYTLSEGAPSFGVYDSAQILPFLRDVGIPQSWRVLLSVLTYEMTLNDVEHVSQGMHRKQCVYILHNLYALGLVNILWRDVNLHYIKNGAGSVFNDYSQLKG